MYYFYFKQGDHTSVFPTWAPVHCDSRYSFASLGLKNNQPKHSVSI